MNLFNFFEFLMLSLDTIALLELIELKRKKFVINEINNSIYGALGEQKVVKELEKLSDDFILINDFTYSFHPPIFLKRIIHLPS